MAQARQERERLERLTVQMRNMLATAKASNRNFTNEERVTYDKMRADFERLEKRIEAIEDPIVGFADGLSPQNSGDLRDRYRKRKGDIDDSPHAQAFNRYLRGGTGALEREEQNQFVLAPHAGTGPVYNTMSTTTGSQGGFIIPTGFSRQLEVAMRWFGGVSGVVGEFSTATGQPLPWPTINDVNNRGRIIGQNVQLAETDLVFNQVQFNAFIGSSDIVLVPLALIEDSFFDLETLLSELLGIRLGRLLNFYCTQGTGVSTPTGIVTAAAAAGNIYPMPTGEPASISYADLVNCEHSVDPAYRYNASSLWMFNDSMLKILKKLVDTQNRPLWQPGISSSFQQGAGIQGLVATQPTILDHQYIINADVSAPAASQYSLLFNDMSKFKVRRVGAEAGGITILRLAERYADYLQLGFTVFLRFDSNLLNAGTAPLVVAQQSAS